MKKLLGGSLDQCLELTEDYGGAVRLSSALFGVSYIFEL